MVVEQIIEVPADRRVFFDLPFEVPVGRARVEVTVVPEESAQKKTTSLLELRGSSKDADTMDAYFARKQANKVFEDGLTKDNPYKMR